MDLTKVLLTNYLPYAKGTIIGRAIPSIDGLKPAQRRILYTMYKMGLQNGNKTKSSNIVGTTMKLHPHGDMAIYETMVRMATGHEALNAPYVESKGNFGKVYSRDLAFAAPRYTEAKLAAICTDIFDGIDENAVDMINNFDDTTKEPTLLPVKFPSILVNASKGIAVGTSSNIPTFGLKEVCEGTIGVLTGTIKNAEELMQILGVPEFTTGGYIHTTKADLTELGETGKQSFVVSGTVVTYPNKIVITEIPYKTNAEDIISAIEEHAKSGELKEVSNVRDDTDLTGFRIVVELKRGAVPSEVLAKICRLTSLRTQMSFTTRVIISDRCEELGIYELLEKWIEFRMACLDRIYKYRLDKSSAQEHLLSSWEKIKLNILDVAKLIAERNESDARDQLMKFYSLDEIQADYILDMKIRMFTQDNLRKKLNELDTTRNNIAEYTNIISSDSAKYKIIVEDLTRIKTKYGTERKTHSAEPIVINDNIKDVAPINDTTVVVIKTKSGYLKRLVSLKDISSYSLPDGEEEDQRWAIKNNDYILIFTYSGECYKILVDSIDASRNGLKDKISNILNIPDEKQIMYVDTAGDYSGYFNLVYPNGRGTRVYYEKVSGNRSKYKSLYDTFEPGKMFVTKAEQFFMITARRKAAFCDLKTMGMLSNRVAFKVARVATGDRIYGLQPAENVPDMSKIDLSKYKKDYCVSIGTDELWHTNKVSEEDADAEAAKIQQAIAEANE